MKRKSLFEFTQKLNLTFSKAKKTFCNNMLDLLKILNNIPDKNR